MQKLYTTLLTLLLLSVFGVVAAQPANDLCQNAIAFPALVLNVQSCVNGTNNGANAEFPYVVQGSCQPTGNTNTPNPSADVWYTFVAVGNQAQITMTSGMTNANIAVYQGTCGNLQGIGCYTSANGNIAAGAATFAPLSPGATYYIQVSGANLADTANFNLCITNIQNSSICLSTTSMSVNPQPVNGTYAPGDTVTFCYSVIQYTQQGANWFHGISIDFGPGWMLPPINIIPAASCDGQGIWGWYNSVTSSATGQTVGPGFFYDSGSGGPLDGNPGNNFGDNSSTCTWTFCWDLVADTAQGASTDLSLDITHYGDGQTGSWSSFSCTQDPIFHFDLFANPCPPPTFTTTPACPGDSNGSATVVPNGTPPYTYLWATGDTTATVTGLPAGPINVSVMDADSCSDTITVVVPTSPGMTLTMDSVDAICGSPTGEASVAVTGGTGAISTFSYAWNPTGQTNDTITGLTPGPYTVVVTDSLGCRDSSTVTVISSGSITASVNTFTDVTCFGAGDGSAVVTITGGAGPYNYIWAPGGQTSDTATGLGPGTYSVFTENQFGCRDTATVTISEPQVVDVTATSSPTTCYGGSDGSATAAATGGTGAYSYSWMPTGINGQTANGLSAGPHQVFATDANGCVDSFLVQVQEPPQMQLQMSGIDETCAGQGDGSASVVVVGGTPPYTYSWSNGGTTQTINNIGPGTFTVTVIDANNCTNNASITLNPIPAPIADAGPDASFCEGTGGTQLFGSAQGGFGAPYYYTWNCTNPACGLSNPNDQNPTVNPSTSNTYYLVVTDSRGCTSAADSVQVDVLERPIVDAGPDVGICPQPAPGSLLNGVSVTGNAGPPYTYQWSPSAGLNNPNIPNPFARPDTTTIYTLVVTSQANGCASDPVTLDTLSTVTVTVHPLPVAEAGPDIDLCLGDSAILQGFATNAGPTYNYEWSPVNNLSNSNVQNPWAFPTQTTDYILVAYSNGCASYGDTVSVNVHTIPTISVGQASIDLCYGDTTQLSATAGGDPTATGYTYAWTPGNTLSDSTIQDPLAWPSQNTTYEVRGTSNWGCESDPGLVDVVIIPSPLAEAGPGVFWCDGADSIQLQGSVSSLSGDPIDPNTITWSWTPPGNLNNSGIPDPTGLPTGSAWYYLTTTVGNCTSTDSVLVTVIPEVVAEVSADTNLFCAGDSVQLTGSGGIGGANYEWYPPIGLSDPNIASPMAAPGDSVEYCLVVTEGGCADTACVELGVLPLPQAAYLNSQPDGCVPFTVSFSENTAGGVLFSWDFGDGSPIVNGSTVEHTYSQPGNYVVTMSTTGPGGCESSVSSTTINVADSAHAAFSSTPSFPVEMFFPNTIVNFLDESDNANSWIWDFGDGNTSSDQNPVHQYLTTGDYFVTLTVTNPQGCISTVSHGPYMVTTPDLFIPNVFTPNGDNNNDRFLVEYTGDQPVKIEVFDRWGVKVYESVDKSEGWDGFYNGTKCQAGTYFYSIYVGGKQYGGDLSLIR